jgi:hypothetical protein
MPESLVREKANQRSMAGASSSSFSPRIRKIRPKPLVPKWMKQAAREFGKDVVYGSDRKRGKRK